ncbi:MAG: phosphoglycerate kinase [Bdellovibrionales bacterium]|nr:phosphoglycerate kinase [Bdellovibrionales bacterium]
MPSPKLYSIEDFDLKDQKVFIRTDFNVPVEEGKVEEHIRLKSALPTIQYALENKAKVIIGSHRGRPEKNNKKNFSLEPFGYYLGNKLNCEVLFVEDIDSVIPSILLSSLNHKKIILLENLRFHTGEEAGDISWAEKLASYVDIYINEAFSVSHRDHTSVMVLPQKVKKRGLGFSMQKERETLDYIRKNSPAPFVLLAGGVKVGDKVKVISRLVDRLDTILIGGVMAYTFLKAKGVYTGAAFIQKESLGMAEEFINRLKIRGKKLLLPIDHVVVPVANRQSPPQITDGVEIPEGFCPMDIGPKTVELFSKALTGAGTVFWNGPFGKFEDSSFAKGTLAMCESIAQCDDAFKVVGGGDSIAAVFKLNKQECFNYISTGGGAALKYLEQGTLPGIHSLLS